MKLSILIVSYNVRDLLERCLRSLERISDDWEVIVVDNDSKDDTKEMLQNVKLPILNFKTILLTQNWGFARGNIEAYKHAKGEYILLLNPDTKVLPGAIEKMVGYLDASSDVWVVGPKLLNEDGSIQRSVRGFPTLVSQILVLLKLHNYLLPRTLSPSVIASGQLSGTTVVEAISLERGTRLPRSLRSLAMTLEEYFLPNFDYSTTQEVDQVMGAALMTRRSVIEKIGFLDPEFRRIFEEVDFCYRVKQAGGKVIYLSEPRIIHSKGESFGKRFTLGTMLKKQYYFNQGMARFFWNNKLVWQSVLLFPFLAASLIGTVILWLLLALKISLVKNSEY